MDNLSQFLAECNAVRAGSLPAIDGLRARASSTGLSLDRMRLAAAAADVEIIKDGDELKVVSCNY
jgi:hypothetical protein